MTQTFDLNGYEKVTVKFSDFYGNMVIEYRVFDSAFNRWNIIEIEQLRLTDPEEYRFLMDRVDRLEPKQHVNFGKQYNKYDEQD